MKHFLVSVICLLFTSFTLAAVEKGSQGEVAQAFIDSYIQDATREGGFNPEKLVQSSPHLTAALSKAHAKVFQQELVDADPILCAQDFPEKSFKVSKVKVEGEKAKVTYTAREEGWDQPIKTELVLMKGTWLIAQIGSL